MEIKAHPSCCGIYILKGFGWDSRQNDQTRYNKDEIIEAVKIRSEYFRGVACIQAVLNDSQNANAPREALLELGFVQVGSKEGYYHPGHSSRIFTYEFMCRGPAREELFGKAKEEPKPKAKSLREQAAQVPVATTPEPADYNMLRTGTWRRTGNLDGTFTHTWHSSNNEFYYTIRSDGIRVTWRQRFFSRTNWTRV